MPTKPKPKPAPKPVNHVPKPAEAPAPPPAPKSIVEEARAVIHLIEAGTADLDHELTRIHNAMLPLQAKAEHTAKKVDRLISGHCRTRNELRELLEETWEDSLAKQAFLKVTWPAIKPLTDTDISEALQRAWNSHCAVGDFVVPRASYRIQTHSVKDLSLTLGRLDDMSQPNERTTIHGQDVVALCRKLMKLPKPEGAPPPAPKPKATKAQPAKKAQQKPAIGTEMDKYFPPRPPAKKPALAPAAKPKLQKQTIHQWRSTVDGMLTRQKMPRMTAAEEADIVTEYEGGTSPQGGVYWVKRRREAELINKDTLEEPPPPNPDDQLEEPMPLEKILPGLGAGALREAYSYETLSTGRVRAVLRGRDLAGNKARDYVCVGMHIESGRYCLHPVVRIDDWSDVVESWRDRKKLTPAGKPLLLAGVTFATADDKETWVFCNDDEQVNVIAPPAPSAATPVAIKPGPTITPAKAGVA